MELRMGGLQRLGDVARRGFLPKELRPHVVVQADHVKPFPHEITDGLRSDQTPRACDDRGRHRPGRLESWGALEPGRLKLSPEEGSVRSSPPTAAAPAFVAR